MWHRWRQGRLEGRGLILVELLVMIVISVLIVLILFHVELPGVGISNWFGGEGGCLSRWWLEEEARGLSVCGRVAVKGKER